MQGDGVIDTPRAGMSITPSPCQLSVRIKFNNQHQPEDLLTDMIRNGLRIKMYSPAKLSLEDYFFDVMGESNNNA